jgi:hypothetical protein
MRPLQERLELFWKRRRYKRHIRWMLRDYPWPPEVRARLETDYRRGWQPRRVP